MKKIFCLLIISFHLIGCENEYQVESIGCNDAVDYLINDYLDKAEYLLIEENFLDAQKLLTEVIDLCEKKDRPSYLGRGLFNRSLVHASLNLETEALADIQYFNQLVKNFSCNQAFSNENTYLVHGEPILGPETISIEECLDRVEGTEKVALWIVSYSPAKSSTKFNLSAAITASSEVAKRCCRSGGIWKACIQPLLVKCYDLKLWEKEQKRLGIWAEPPIWD